MTAFLKTLLLLSIAGTLCGLFLVLLRKVAGRKIPASLFYFAWMIVVLRFAVPVNGMIPVGNSAPGDIPSGPVFSEPQSDTKRTETTVAPSAYSQAELPAQPAQNQAEANQSQSNETEGGKKAVFIPTVLFLAWCCGTAGFLLWNGISYFRFESLLKKSLIRPSRHVLNLYDEACPSRKPTLKRSDAVSAPMTFGIVRPVLVIPDTEVDDTALKNIFLHEIIHFKRHDILLKWIFLLVFSVHWFNPFVRWFRKEIDKVCELSCDELLLRKMNTAEKRSYGETLLAIAENACNTPCRMVTGFSGGKLDLKERLIQIMSYKKKSRIAIAIALIPILILCGSALALGPKAAKVSGPNVVNVSTVDELLAAIAPNTEIHLAPGTYHLTKATSYGKAEQSKYYQWNNYGFTGQYELCIQNANGLSIIGDEAEILTVPRSSNVLVFKNCADLSLGGLTVGHTEAAQACEGGVIRLENCVRAGIDNCRLYGCGTIGIYAEESDDLKITNTDIYHCSSAGIYCSSSAGLSAERCRIYDCGKPEKYQSAVAAFILYNTSGASFRSCEVYDNYLQDLIQGNADKAAFDGITVRDNHISSAFSFDGDVELKDFAFSGNTVDKWMGAFQDGKITIDGTEVTEDDLSALWGEQLSSAGIGAAEADYLPIDSSGTREVHVQTADEFLAAIASDTTVYIDVPQIDLTECSDYGEGTSKSRDAVEFEGKPYTWVYCYDGYELFIGNVSNFHIVGGEIVTRPRYANVLNFAACSGITLENVHLGHTHGQGTCMGGVLNLQGSDQIILEGCDLYGCGILGIQAQNVQDLHVQNTLIHDCSNGAAWLQDSDNVVFLGCDVVNCPDPHFFLAGCENFSWDNKLMDPHSSFNVNDDARNPFEEAMNSVVSVPAPLTEADTEKSVAVNVACMVVNAYAKGYDGFELTIKSYLSRTSAIGVYSEITPCDFPVYWETTEGLIPAEEIFPAQMIQICRMDGADDITDDEPEGTTRTITIYFRTSTDHPEQESSYFKVDLIREDGCWRVVRF